jgi:hypothetical protein
MDYDSGQGSSQTVLTWMAEERLNKKLDSLLNHTHTDDAMIELIFIIKDLVKTLRG